MARIRLIAATSLPTLAAFSGALAAQEYCVACTEPAALYRCILEDAKPGAAPSLQVACISRIAKEGGHGQCTVKRGVTVFECDGILKRISLANEPPAVPPAANAAPVPAAAPQPPADDQPPKTVAEMAKRAKADSERQWEKTGRFFSNSFACIASLFTKCSAGEH